MVNATTALSSGDVERAGRILEQCNELSPARRELFARIRYLQGRYQEAIREFTRVVGQSRSNPIRRYRARRNLSLAYFQTNNYAAGGRLPLRDPVTRLMRSTIGQPNRIVWSNGSGARLEFREDEPWQLPTVAVSVNGEESIAKVDTGGDLFSLPWVMAERLGIKPVATTTGLFAGGHRAKIAFGILDRLDLGGAVVHNVPVSINSFDYPVIGTGLLRQFRPSLDYPNRHLILHPRSSECECSGFRFLLAATHLLIADCAVNGIAMKALLDSGLEVTNGAGLLAPEQTLHSAGIAVPDTSQIEGSSGAGKARLDVGEFTVKELAVGDTVRTDVVGLTGIFPWQLARPGAIGFPIGALVSHGFLRHHRWTLDFDCMRMRLAAP